MDEVTAFAPGRVNLIGDHTDHTDGWCLPMALTMGVTVRGDRVGGAVALRSDAADGLALVPLDVTEPAELEPAWARYVAGVIAELCPSVGLRGEVTADLPADAGLSSSAALEVAVALALGAADDDPVGLARICQRAEQRASGVPCGILDQLSATSGVAGHALLVDCAELTTTPIPVPDDLEIVVVHSGEHRTLAGSAYAERRRECEEAQARIGPLRSATPADVAALDDPVLRRRARHVVTENRRVHVAVEAFRAGDVDALGELLDDSHRSLRDDFECSTPRVDAAVERLRTTPGVHGVRMTGGGWGGCVVAVTEPGALDEGWRVEPGGAAWVSVREAGPSGPRTRPR
ncbi:MAG: galactokinase [Acidimicrobiales bacterium]|nr:galactokinase [Acidimicrobiales bacterium]